MIVCIMYGHAKLSVVSQIYVLDLKQFEVEILKCFVSAGRKPLCKQTYNMQNKQSFLFNYKTAVFEHDMIKVRLANKSI